MGRREDLLAKIKHNPKNVHFEQLDKLLKMYGFDCRNKGGSHYIYKRKGCASISVPRHIPVGEVYVKKAIAAIESRIDLDIDGIEK